MTATRPHPRPGILEIDALCARQEQRAGRRQGVQAVVERDAARPEPARDRGLQGLRRHLEDYPDGAASALRDAIGRAFGLDPERIVCGAGSDDLLASACARLSRPTATRRSIPRTAFWSIRS